MNRLLVSALSGILAFQLTLSPRIHAAEATDEQVDARKMALDIAGAFVNDGFHLRDGFYTGTLAPGKAVVIQVNLYIGNEYWFTVAGAGGVKKVNMKLYDEKGLPVEIETAQHDSVTTLGYAPDASGPYYLRFELAEGASGGYCLIYSYK